MLGVPQGTADYVNNFVAHKLSKHEAPTVP
jgi:hypothetical protein